MIFRLVISLAIVFLFVSCGDDVVQEDGLSEQLNQRLTEASNGQGLSYFQLPNPTDLSAIPQDPRNPLTTSKVTLGKFLFHETAFGTEGNFPITKGEYSCASCHHAESDFQAGIPQGLGEGGEGFGINGEGRIRNVLCAPELCDVQPIRTPTIINGAFQPVMLWNGQFGATDVNEGTEAQWTPETPKAVNELGYEGLETQAIAGLTVHRIGINESSVEANGYKELFDQVFRDVPVTERYSTEMAGLAIAAYERTVLAYDAPFQKYLRGNTYAMSDNEKQGAILFFGKAECATCHTGPALNKMEFHALGMKEFNPDEVIHYDPMDPTRFGRFSFTGVESDRFTFKTPQLYNLRDIKFLGHGSSMHSVKEVVEYKNRGVAENDEVPSDRLSEHFRPLGLTDLEVDQITAFINYALYDPSMDKYVPTSLPSGQCFPNNDAVSRLDLDCN